MVSQEALKSFKTNKGEDLLDLSNKSPVMLVFLRHFGCIFCQKALIDLSKRKEALKLRGIKLILVHSTDPDSAQPYLERFEVADIDCISDPETKSYEAFGLTKGNFKQLFGLKNWASGFELFVTTKAKGSLRQIGDGFQMPGIFILQDGKIKEKYIHNMISDQPDYDALIQCCIA